MHFMDNELFKHQSCSTVLWSLTHSGVHFLSYRETASGALSFTVPHSADLHRCDEKIPRDEFLGPDKLLWSSLWSKIFVEQVLGFTVTHLGLLGRKPLKGSPDHRSKMP